MSRYSFNFLALFALSLAGCPKPPPLDPAPVEEFLEETPWELSDLESTAENVPVEEPEQPGIIDQSNFISVFESVVEIGGTLDRDKLGVVRGIDVSGNEIEVAPDLLREILLVPGLKKLRVGSPAADRETLRMIERHVELEDLGLQDTITDDDSLVRLIDALPNLKRIRLRRVFNVLDDGFTALSKKENLQVLELIAVRIDDVSLGRICDSRSLTTLDLRECNDLTFFGYEKLRNIPQLEELRVGGLIVGDHCLRIATELPNLRHLTVAGGQITPEGLAEYVNGDAGMRLRHLELTKLPHFDDAALSVLWKSPSLKSLVIRSIPVRGDFLDSLASEAGVPYPVEIMLFERTSFDEKAYEKILGFKTLKRLGFIGLNFEPAMLKKSWPDSPNCKTWSSQSATSSMPTSNCLSTAGIFIR